MSKVKHVALFKFKDGTSQESIDKVLDAILEMTESIPGIEDYVAGTNNSPETFNEGLTHGFVMTLADSAARDAYLTHPEHERVKSEVMPYVERVVVFDFEV